MAHLLPDTTKSFTLVAIMRALLLLAIILFFSCSSTGDKSHLTDTNHSDTFSVKRTSSDSIHLRKLTKLHVIGNFDGDCKEDTIYQHNFSKLHHIEIDSSADPFQSDWDTVVKWFYDQRADVYLTVNTANQDTLHLGVAQGLYCLLNIGDNNADGQDEIAFVVDYCDFSWTNSCRIYTLCNHKWTELEYFGIHEDAFVFTSGTIPIFRNIKGFLENRSGRWFYLDYYKDVVEPQTMQPLKLDKCR